MFQTKFVEKIKRHILCSVTFFSFRKSFLLRNNVEKDCRARQATNDNMAHAHCMLGTWDYKHTLTICTTYWFSTAAMVARTRPFVTFDVHCLSCLILHIFNAVHTTAAPFWWFVHLANSCSFSAKFVRDLQKWQVNRNIPVSFWSLSFKALKQRTCHFTLYPS